MDKTWCNKCNGYTYQTSGGCIECGQVIWLQGQPMKTDDITIVLTAKDFQYFIEHCTVKTTGLSSA